MSEVMAERLSETVEDARELYHKLIIVIGYREMDNPGVVQSLSDALDAKAIFINQELSEALLDVPQEHRQFQARDWLIERVRNADEDVIVLSDIELIFAEQLRLQPMSLLEALSRHKPIILMWPGEYDGSQLIYAEPGHPEYIKHEPEGIVIETESSEH